jgi:hypothetical protein
VNIVDKFHGGVSVSLIGRTFCWYVILKSDLLLIFNMNAVFSDDALHSMFKNIYYNIYYETSMEYIMECWILQYIYDFLFIQIPTAAFPYPH